MSQETTTRKATHAGSWYSASQRELEDSLNQWLSAGQPSSDAPPAKALIAPHAGFSYSGATAAFAYSHVRPDVVDTVFVLGPSHHVFLDSCALTACALYETPLGDLTVDLKIVKDLQSTNQFTQMSLSTDEDEHSIEMHLPYIKAVMDKKSNGSYSIVPILVGALTPAKSALYGRILSPYLAQTNTLFVVSSDFCHWGSRFNYTPQNPPTPIHQHIEALDREAMALIERLDIAGFSAYLARTKNTICGRHPISLLLQTVAAVAMRQSTESMQNHSGFELQFVRYTQSSRVTRVTDSSVSYASGVLYSL
ncbi:cell motility mediator [Obelidium mucronatum]|nr:cell motility mediator [Obelidium mucronatum]